MSSKNIVGIIIVAIIFAVGGYFVGRGTTASQEASLYSLKTNSGSSAKTALMNSSTIMVTKSQLAAMSASSFGSGKLVTVTDECGVSGQQPPCNPLVELVAQKGSVLSISFFDELLNHCSNQGYSGVSQWIDPVTGYTTYACADISNIPNPGLTKN